MQGLVSNGQQEKKVAFPLNPPPPLLPNPTFFTAFLPTRAIQPVLFLVSYLRWGGATYILMSVRQKDFS